MPKEQPLWGGSSLATPHKGVNVYDALMSNQFCESDFDFGRFPLGVSV